MEFDYKDSKKQILGIINSKTKIEKKPIPKSESEFTYENGIRSWVGSIFVDIVDSSSLFKNQKEEIIARIIREFSSGIIEILNSKGKLRQIGLRGDCVFAIYSAEYQSDLVDIFRLSYQINTYMKMLNKLLENNDFPKIVAGIGLGASEDLVIKERKKQSGYNDLVFIGDAVVDASNLSGVSNRQSIGAIAMNNTFYSNIIDELKKENSKYSNWIKPKYSNTYYTNSSSVQYYHCEIIQTDFNDWIDGGMR